MFYELKNTLVKMLTQDFETNNSDPELEIPQFWLETPFLVYFSLLHTTFGKIDGSKLHSKASL